MTIAFRLALVGIPFETGSQWTPIHPHESIPHYASFRESCKTVPTQKG